MNIYSIDKLWNDFDLWYVFKNHKCIGKFNSKKKAEAFLTAHKKEHDL